MNNLQVLEYKNERILLTAQLAEGYEATEKMISNNFNRNKERFVEGKHYYELKGEELKAFKKAYPLLEDNLKYAPILYLWTEKGTLRHAKILDTDKAWEVYEKLEETYFRVQNNQPKLPKNYKEALQHLVIQVEENEKLQIQVNKLKPHADYTQRILQNKGLVNISQIAKDYGMSGRQLNKILHKLGVQYKQSEQWLLYKTYQDKGYVHSETIRIPRTDGTAFVKMRTKWTQKGRFFLYDLLKQNGYLPVIELHYFD